MDFDTISGGGVDVAANKADAFDANCADAAAGGWSEFAVTSARDLSGADEIDAGAGELATGDTAGGGLWPGSETAC